MKKIIIFLLLLLLAPIFVSATIDQNLYYGLRQNDEVRELQQFLISKGFLTGQPTGNFLSLTLGAVKKYQASKNINTTGYVGPLTRQAINADQGVNTTQNITPPTGSLDLAQNAKYSDQSVIAPQTNFKLADFFLTNNTTEAINLKTIEADLAIGSDLYTSNLYVTNLYAIYGSSKTVILGTVSHNNYWTVNLKLAVGQSIDLSLYGDVNSSIPVNSTINASVLVTGVSAVSATSVSTNSNTALAGQNIIFGTSSFTVSEDGSTPSSKIFAANQRIVAGKFQFTATNDSYTISELKFIIPNASNISVISGAVLSDTATQATLAQVSTKTTPVGNNSMFDFNVNIPVALNASKSLTVYYDLGQVINSNGANINVSPILVYVKAKNNTGTLIDGVAANYNNIMMSSYGGITLPNSGVLVNSIYIFKSIPTLNASAATTSALNNANTSLYTFSIAADPSGDISVKQIMFTITITDLNNSFPHFNNFTFFKGNTDYTGSVYIGTTANNNYIGLTSNNGIGIGANTVVVTFNREETIPAGKIQTYTLKALSNNFIVSSTLGANSVSTYIPSDANASTSGSYLRMAFTNIYGLSQTSTGISVANYNLLWSDKAAAAFFPHSDLNGFSTNDWYNGFGVLNLPLPSQTITAE